MQCGTNVACTRTPRNFQHKHRNLTLVCRGKHVYTVHPSRCTQEDALSHWSPNLTSWGAPCRVQYGTHRDQCRVQYGTYRAPCRVQYGTYWAPCRVQYGAHRDQCRVQYGIYWAPCPSPSPSPSLAGCSMELIGPRAGCSMELTDLRLCPQCP